jgi:hypothetical protein
MAKDLLKEMLLDKVQDKLIKDFGTSKGILTSKAVISISWGFRLDKKLAYKILKLMENKYKMVKLIDLQ